MPTDPRPAESEDRSEAGAIPGRTLPPPPPDPVDQPAWTAEPVAADTGRIVSPPAMDPYAAVSERGRTLAAPDGAADARARQQILTGRAAALSPVSLSPGQLAWRRLKKNRVAMLGGVILLVMYTMALFAPFIAPY